jgi:hypothetical protein
MAVWLAVVLLPGALILLPLIWWVIRRIARPPEAISLAPRQTYAVPLARGSGIRVLDGRLWVTTSGSVQDAWLKEGDEYYTPTHGLTVLEAVGTRASFERIAA